MKKVLSVTACAVALFSSCNKDVAMPEGDFNASLPAGRPLVEIPVNSNGIITKNRLSKDTVWMIPGVAFVNPGTTLTIDPGTYLTAGRTITHYGDGTQEAVEVAGVLVVPKTAKIHAEGTAAEPIVFTSPKSSDRAAGDFGGIILLGQAPTNQTNPRMIGIPQYLSVDAGYGGNFENDDSGILKYVRIEFAGDGSTYNNEINGLTLGGVGSGTTLSHIQVSWALNNAFRFSGGTVNADHLIAVSNGDDDFDFDFGYRGTIKHSLSLKDPNSTNSTALPYLSDSNGLESENDGHGSSADPKTRPNLQNFTFLGISNAVTAATKLKFGNRWRRATAMTITRSIIAGYGTGVAFENITSSGSTFSNNVVHGYTTAITGTPTPANYTGNSTSTAANANSYLLLGGVASIDPFYSTASASTFDPWNLVPFAGPASGPNYKGAFDPKAETLWTDGWTEFQPKTY